MHEDCDACTIRYCFNIQFYLFGVLLKIVSLMQCSRFRASLKFDEEKTNSAYVYVGPLDARSMFCLDVQLTRAKSIKNPRVCFLLGLW